MNPALQAAIEADNWPGPWTDEFLDGLTRLSIDGGRVNLDRCFPGVTTLMLDRCHLPSLAELAQLPALKDLCLFACRVDDWTWPVDLHLEEIELTHMSPSREQLGSHPALREFVALHAHQDAELEVWLRSLGTVDEGPDRVDITVTQPPPELPMLTTVRFCSPFVNALCAQFQPEPICVQQGSGTWTLSLGRARISDLSEEELLERVADKEATLAELRALGAPVPPPPDPFRVAQSWEEARERVQSAEGLSAACRQGMLRFLDRFPGQGMVRVPAERLPMLAEPVRRAFDTLSGADNAAMTLAPRRRSRPDSYDLPCSGTEDPWMQERHDAAGLYQVGVSMEGTCLLVDKLTGELHAAHLDDMGALPDQLAQTLAADSLGELLAKITALEPYT